VYPAAGLIHYVPLDVPKYIIDRKIPVMDALPNMQLIEQPATEGIETLLKKLAL
jgi:NAD-dependent deacetylase